MVQSLIVIKPLLESNNFDIDITDSIIKPAVCETNLVDLAEKIKSLTMRLQKL